MNKSFRLPVLEVYFLGDREMSKGVGVWVGEMFVWNLLTCRVMGTSGFRSPGQRCPEDWLTGSCGMQIMSRCLCQPVPF